LATRLADQDQGLRLVRSQLERAQERVLRHPVAVPGGPDQGKPRDLQRLHVAMDGPEADPELVGDLLREDAATRAEGGRA